MSDLVVKAQSVLDPTLQTPWRKIKLGLQISSLGLLLLASLWVAGRQISAYVSEYDRMAREELRAIAEAKTGRITAWRAERLNDGEVIRGLAPLAAAAQRFLAAPQDQAARGQLEQWMSAWLKHGDYRRVVLLDAQRKARLAVPQGPASVEPFIEEWAGEAMRTHGVLLCDLNRNEASGQIKMDLLVPLAGTGDAAAGADSPDIGVLCLEIDPSQRLYPILQSWPVASPSGETVLVRREETSVLVLNDLRHQLGTALTLRLPLSNPDLPSARAARGQTGAIEGQDYRRVDVLAALAGIPDSPWFLVAKVDAREVFAPVRNRLWIFLGAAATALAILLLAQWWLVRRQKLKMVLCEAAAEREREAMLERIASLTRDTSDVMLLADTDWKILEANDRAVEAYGHPLSKLRQMTVRNLVAAHTRAEFDRQTSKILQEGALTMATAHQRKDDSIFPVDFLVRVVRLSGLSYFQVVIRDLTESQHAAGEIRRLNRTREVFNGMARAIAQTRSRSELFGQVCRLAVEAGGFKLAWIGGPDPDSGLMRSLAVAGADAEPVPEIVFSFEASRTEGCGPGGTAFREQKTVLAENLSADTRATIRKETAGRPGIQSCGAFPLRRGGQVWGVFCLYSAEPNLFVPQEVAIWEDAARNLSLALETFDK